MSGRTQQLLYVAVLAVLLAVLAVGIVTGDCGTAESQAGQP
ncbi:hypothetical protein [Streptomyces sp. NPDC055036]